MQEIYRGISLPKEKMPIGKLYPAKRQRKNLRKTQVKKATNPVINEPQRLAKTDMAQEVFRKKVVQQARRMLVKGLFIDVGNLLLFAKRTILELTESTTGTTHGSGLLAKN